MRTFRKRKLSFAYFAKEISLSFCFERLRTKKNSIKNDPSSPNVNSRSAIFLFQDHFRSHISRCTTKIIQSIFTRVSLRSKSEVNYFSLTVRCFNIHKNIFHFQVPMADIFSVIKFHSFQ
jgi:hypothetical protein